MIAAPTLNRYETAAERRTHTEDIIAHKKYDLAIETKGNIPHSLLATSVDLLIGGLAGGLGAAWIGRPSLYAGLGISALGHYIDNKLIKILGVGMIAYGGSTLINSPVNGPDESLEGAKERLMAFKQSLIHRLFIDKFFKPTASTNNNTATTPPAVTAATSGFGEIQYFNFAPTNEIQGLDEPDEIQTPMAAVPMTEDNTVNGNNDDPALNANPDEPLDLKGLDDIENQLSDAAAEFQGLNGDKSVETTIPEHPEEKLY